MCTQMRVPVVIVLLAVLSGTAEAGMETVEIARVQTAKALSGVVRDPVGDPVPGAIVKEVSPDTSTVIQSVMTDADGKFAISPKSRNKVYHLFISRDGFNPLLVHVKISRWSSHFLDLKLHVAT